MVGPAVSKGKQELLLNLIPTVLKKKGDDVVEELFDITRIKESLIDETSLSAEQLENVMIDVIRALVIYNLPVLSGPMIRELACAAMLSRGYIQQRLQYTRIGLPLADLEEMISDHSFDEKIVKHIRWEYDQVRLLIQKRVSDN